MRKRLLVSLLIVVSVVALDQLTKYLARTMIHPLEPIRLLPVLELVNVRNEGAAFGMFREFGNTFFITVSLLAISFMAWIIASAKEDYRVFSLLMSGAIGNLIDRVTLGYVVDFVYVGYGRYHWPAFNVADSALTGGICFMIFMLLRRKA